MTERAFTLAEVLITLAIIGVVAAMTIPMLIAKHQEKVTAAKLKKIYSVFSQAYLSATDENGTPDTWGIGGSDDPVGAQNVFNNITPYLKLSKNCGLGKGCFPAGKRLALNSSISGDDFEERGVDAKGVLADGISFVFIAKSDSCSNVRGTTDELKHICALLIVDTNGFALPNTYGKDTFLFYLTKNSIMPAGLPDDSMYNFRTSCKTTSEGRGCTAWVIYKENMDYLHCNNLSWDGPTKCD